MKHFLLLCLSLIIYTLHAEEPKSFSISGIVKDSTTNGAVDYAVVALKDGTNDKIMASAFTDVEGSFSIPNVKSGNYWLHITFVGYKPFALQILVDKNIRLDDLKIAPNSTQLNQVEVIAEKNMILKEAGKTTYNVSKSTMNTGGSLEDVIRNLPNVAVDQKGNISIAGKKSVSVWLDGKPSAMAAVDVASFLKSIPASSIESIEVITNPSAKYDAEGTGGIIHIHLKKEKRNGMNGNISAGYGFLYRDNVNASLNLRKGKWNVFGSYGFRRGYEQHIYAEDRRIRKGDSTYYYNMYNTGTDKSYNNTGKLGLDYIPDDKTTISYTVNVNQVVSKEEGKTEGRNLDSNKEQTLLFKTINSNRTPSLTLSNDISIRKQLDTSGREISASFTHTWVKNESNAALQTTAFDKQNKEAPGLNFDRKTPSKNDIHNMIFQFDFEEPTLFGSKLETGIKNETTLNRNNYEVYDAKNNTYVKNNLLSNGFNYTENIFAYYAMLSGPIKKWLEYSAGLRMEHTFIKSNTSGVNRNYLSFFPNAGLTAHINKEQSIGLTYSRRVQRPVFQQLNNVVFYNDPYSTWQGNPLLRPSFEDLLSFNYSYSKKKVTISFDAEGSFSKDRFSEGTKLDAEGISRSGFYNGSRAYFLSASFFTKFDVTKWWTLQMNNGYNYQHYTKQAGINDKAMIGHEYNLWLNSSFKFWKTAAFEIGGWLNTGGVGAQGRGFPAGMLNAGIKKTFLKNKLSVNISGRNLLNTMNFRWVLENDPLYAKGKWHVLNRTVFVSLTYNFGSSNKFERKEKEGNARLGGGSGRGN